MTLSHAMKRLSQTWRQKAKTTEQTSKYQQANIKNQFKGSASLQGNGSSPFSSSEQCSLFNSSFGFDTQTLSVVDRIEQEHARKHLPLSEPSPLATTICGESKDMQSTPNATSCKNMVGRSEQQVERSNLVSSMATTAVVRCDQNEKTASESRMLHNSCSKVKNREKMCKDIASEEKSVRKAPETGKANVQPSHRHDSVQCDMKTPETVESKLNEGKTSTTNEPNTQNGSQSSLDQCELSSWGLPDNILEQYKKIGIMTMFEWQAQCLRTGNVLNGGNALNVN